MLKGIALIEEKENHIADERPEFYIWPMKPLQAVLTGRSVAVAWGPFFRSPRSILA